MTTLKKSTSSRNYCQNSTYNIHCIQSCFTLQVLIYNNEYRDNAENEVDIVWAYAQKTAAKKKNKKNQNFKILSTTHYR